MDANPPINKATRWAGAAGLLAAGIIGGGVLASALGANAATTTGAGSTTTGSSTSPSSTAPTNFPAHGSSAHESEEKVVTGTSAAKARAAAIKASGGGTAGDVTSDFTGSGYEITVTKADGSTTEVHLDSSFAVEDHGSH